MQFDDYVNCINKCESKVPEKDFWQQNHLTSKTFYLKVFPFTNCKTVTEPQQFRETKLTAKKFIEKSCTQSKRTIPHKKLLPDCKNVTKQNCVLTNWETDKYGNQVRNSRIRSPV